MKTVILGHLPHFTQVQDVPCCATNTFTCKCRDHLFFSLSLLLHPFLFFASSLTALLPSKHICQLVRLSLRDRHSFPRPSLFNYITPIDLTLCPRLQESLNEKTWNDLKVSHTRTYTQLYSRFVNKPEKIKEFTN